MTDTTTDSYQLLWLNPAELIAHPRNIRTDVGDLSELRDSIAANGVIEPLTVVPHPDGGGYDIVAGHRRAAAAAEAGVPAVPCVARADLVRASDEDPEALARHIGTMLSENVLREGLTAAEQARGVQQMLDLGMNVADITKATGFQRKHVIKAAAAARVHVDSTYAADLTLDQLAAISEFHDDDEAREALTEAAAEGPGEFAHELTRRRRDRADRAELERVRAELTAQGHRLLDDDDHPSHNGTVNRYLSGLSVSADDRTELTPEAHADCPGRAFRIGLSFGGQVRTDEVCTAPFEHGHGERWDSSTTSSAPVRRDDMTDEQAEQAREERRMVIANNKAMVAANDTRREWVKQWLTTRRMPKPVLRFCIETFHADPAGVSWWFSQNGGTADAEDAIRTLGLTRPSSWTTTAETLTSGETVPDDRLPSQLAAHIAAAYEGTIDRTSWREGRESHARWLRFLEGQGYTLADVEHHLLGVADQHADAKADRARLAAELGRQHADAQEADDDVVEDDEDGDQADA